jgi:hypothetical protein
MFTSQNGNSALGDIVGGPQTKNITNNYASNSPFNRLYERLRSANDEHPYVAQIAEQLQHYCSQATESDIRGLEEKLIAAGRTDILLKAKRLKEVAAKTIARWQTSGVAQDILTIILGQLYADFMQHATPAIEAQKSREEVDLIISEQVVRPAAQMLGDNDLMLTSADILGLLFFLGGNCHVRWDKC